MVNNGVLFDFDSYVPEEFLVCYRGSRSILTEATEAAAINFRNASLKGARFEMDNQVVKGARMEGMGDAQVVLLAGCLFQTVPDPDAPAHLRDKDGKGWKMKKDKSGNPVPVPQHELKGWGSKITKPLFEKAKEISGLNEAPPPAAAPAPNTLTNHDGYDRSAVTHTGYDDGGAPQFNGSDEVAYGDAGPKGPAPTTTPSR